MTQPQADWGRALVRAAERPGAPSRVSGVTRACTSFPFGDTPRLLWPRVTHRPNGKTISTGECFFHIPQCCEQHCDLWHFSDLMPEPRRAPSLL